MTTAILFILMMLILIIPHEFGHFIVAKLCGVQVNEFSMGMGPLLFKKVKGETTYSLRLLPIGGFCAMEGENGDEKGVNNANPRAFNNKSPLQKIAILSAGVIMNVLLAVIIFTICMMIRTVPTNEIDVVSAGSPAAEAGIESGYRLIGVNGVESTDWAVLSYEISKYSNDGLMEIVVSKDGDRKTFFITPRYDEELQRYLIGIQMKSTRNPFDCTRYGMRTAWSMNLALLESFKMLFTGQVSKDDVSGPVGVVKIVNQAQSKGFLTYLMLLGLMSLNVAILNILPFPALDGGRIIFVILRALTGDAITDKVEAAFHAAGMIILIGLIILITFNDIMNLF